MQTSRRLVIRIVFFLVFLYKTLVVKVGGLIGKLIDIDVGVTGECFGKYMQIRVAINVLKPLKRFLRLELSKGKESMLLLRYEKLQE